MARKILNHALLCALILTTIGIFAEAAFLSSSSFRQRPRVLLYSTQVDPDKARNSSYVPLHSFSDLSNLKTTDEFVSEVENSFHEQPRVALAQSKTMSQIRTIRSRHLVGIVNSADGKDIVISFEDDQNLIAITGETASGKSLLIARVVELLMGGKAAYTIVASVILGMGRALGETMAVIMMIGNSLNVPVSPLDSATTLTSNIGLEMAYASGAHRQALFAMGIVLFVIIMVLNGLTTTFVRRRQGRSA